MKSRRCMYPLRENLIDASSLTLCDGAAGGKGQPIDHRRCDPMSELGQKLPWQPRSPTSALPPKADSTRTSCLSERCHQRTTALLFVISSLSIYRTE